MKKSFFSLVLIAVIIGSIAPGCHSKKKASAEAKKSTTAPVDTVKKDTVKH